VRVAELGRPGEVEEVVVEVLSRGGLERKRRGAWMRGRFGCWLGRGLAGGEEEKKDEEGWCGFLLHSGRRIAGA
jgi:hypothetical protein